MKEEKTGKTTAKHLQKTIEKTFLQEKTLRKTQKTQKSRKTK